MSRERVEKMLIFHYYLCKFSAVLQYCVIVFKNDLCVCDNILMYHIKSLGSSSKQPKIDTCAQPDCVNQQDWQQCQVAVCVHVFALTRVWALASPASALSFNCSTDKSSSGSSSGGEGDAFNVHTSISINQKLLSESVDYIICSLPNLQSSITLLKEQCDCADFYTLCSRPAMNKSPLTYLVTWE